MKVVDLDPEVFSRYLKQMKSLNLKKMPDFKKENRFLSSFFDIADLDYQREIFVEIFSPSKRLSQRIYAYRKYKKIIDNLKEDFKKIVMEKNKAVRKVGYKNFFEFVRKSNGVPDKDYQFFLGNVDKAIEKIFKIFPYSIENIKWTRYNIPRPDASFSYSDPILTWKQIYKLMSVIRPELKKFRDRITIEEKKEEFFSSASYKETEKKVVINLAIPREDEGKFNQTLSLIHELSHAVNMLDLAEKGINPLDISKYQSEEAEIKIEREFAERFFTEGMKVVLKVGELEVFTRTLFEKEIYERPRKDFDEIYARMLDRCYPPSKQRKNPFYVLDNHYILRPAKSVIYSVVIVKNLLES